MSDLYNGLRGPRLGRRHGPAGDTALATQWRRELGGLQSRRPFGAFGQWGRHGPALGCGHGCTDLAAHAAPVSGSLRRLQPGRPLHPVATSSPTGNLAENRAYAQVWDAASGRPVTPPLWHTRAITSAVFSPDSRRFVTTSYGDGAQVWNLRPDTRSVDDLQRLAQVLSGTKLDDNGTLRPLEPSELREAYEALRSQDAEIFTASRAQVLGSHYEQALACETAGAWEAALGHLNVLIEAGRGLEALRLRRAQVHAELEHWREAAEDYRSLGLSDGDWFYDWYSLALLELGSGNRDGYRAACAAMLRAFGKPESSGEPAEFTAWACALGPHAVDDYGPAIALAERLRAAHPKSQMIGSAIGALLFRAGRFEQAAARLTEADRLDKDPRSSPIYTWFFLAMAHDRLGHAAEAKSWRDKALAATEQALADHARGAGERLPWRRRLTSEAVTPGGRGPDPVARFRDDAQRHRRVRSLILGQLASPVGSARWTLHPRRSVRTADPTPERFRRC